MAVSVLHSRFQKDITGTNGATQDIDVGFPPKAVIVFGQGTNTNNSVVAHYQWSQGFSDGTNSTCVCITSDDADAAADTQTVHSGDSVYVRMDETSNATVLERATVSFPGGNIVRFTWAVNSTQASIIQMLTFGGDDITNAKVNMVSVGRSTIGTQDYTGLGFNPGPDGESVLFTLSSFFQVPSNTSVLGASSHFGCAVSASKEWSIGNVMEDTRDPSDTWRITDNSHCLINLDETTGALHYSAEFDSWITDGFRLNYTDAPSATVWDFSYLVIKGGTWDVGTLTTPTTATNDVDTAVSVSSRTLRGLLLASTAGVTSGSINTYAIVSIGVTDGTTQSVLTCIDEDAQATMDSYRLNTNACIAKPLGVDGAIPDIGVFDSFSTDNFRLDWTAKSSNAQLYGWVVVADGPVVAAEEVEEFVAKSFGTIGLTNTTGNQTIFGG